MSDLKPWSKHVKMSWVGIGNLSGALDAAHFCTGNAQPLCMEPVAAKHLGHAPVLYILEHTLAR